MSAVFDGLLNPPACRPGDYVPKQEFVERSRAGNTRKKERRFGAPPNPWGLSGAEWAVLTDVMETGDGYAEVSARLCMAEKTCATHAQRAREKMAAKTTLHAVLMLDRWMRAPKVDVELLVRFVDGKPTIEMRTPGSAE